MRTRIRLLAELKEMQYSTAFGRVVGKNQIRHSAFAIAGVSQRGFGGVLPFGMPAGAGTGDGYACIKSNSGGQSEAPCDGPDSGNFGTIDIGFFGNEDLGTTQNCGFGSIPDVAHPQQHRRWQRPRARHVANRRLHPR